MACQIKINWRWKNHSNFWYSNLKIEYCKWMPSKLVSLICPNDEDVQIFKNNFDLELIGASTGYPIISSRNK